VYVERPRLQLLDTVAHVRVQPLEQVRSVHRALHDFHGAVKRRHVVVVSEALEHRQQLCRTLLVVTHTPQLLIELLPHALVHPTGLVHDDEADVASGAVHLEALAVPEMPFAIESKPV
jgi:hypothetical protein